MSTQRPFSQLIPVGKEVVRMTVESSDPALDLSKVKISFDWPTEEEIQEAHLTNDSEPYRRCRIGFGAIEE